MSLLSHWTEGLDPYLNACAKFWHLQIHSKYWDRQRQTYRGFFPEHMFLAAWPQGRCITSKSALKGMSPITLRQREDKSLFLFVNFKKTFVKTKKRNISNSSWSFNNKTNVRKLTLSQTQPQPPSASESTWCAQLQGRVISISYFARHEFHVYLPLLNARGNVREMVPWPFGIFLFL